MKGKAMHEAKKNVLINSLGFVHCTSFFGILGLLQAITFDKLDNLQCSKLTLEFVVEVVVARALVEALEANRHWAMSSVMNCETMGPIDWYPHLVHSFLPNLYDVNDRH